MRRLLSTPGAHSIRGSKLGSGSMLAQIPADLRCTEQVRTQKIEVGPAVHLPLHHLQLRVLLLGLAVRPGLRQRGVYGGAILNDALREGSQQAWRGVGGPRLQIGTPRDV